MVQNAAEFISIAFSGDCDFDCFGDSTAKAAGGSREFCIDLAADVGIHRGRRSDIGTEDSHYFSSERLLFIGTFDHEDLTVEIEVRAGH